MELTLLPLGRPERRGTTRRRRIHKVLLKRLAPALRHGKCPPDGRFTISDVDPLTNYWLQIEHHAR